MARFRISFKIVFGLLFSGIGTVTTLFSQPIYLSNETKILSEGLMPWIKFINDNKENSTIQTHKDCIIQVEQNKIPYIRQYSEIQIHEYIPKNCFYATLDTGISISTLSEAGVIQIYLLKTEDKISPRITSFLSGKVDNKALEVWIHLSPRISSHNAIKIIAETYTHQLANRPLSYIPITHAVSGWIKREIINELASMDIIKFIDLAPEEGFSENDQSITCHRSNRIASYNQPEIPLDGSGIHIQMNDEGMIGNHIDYKNRVNQSEALPTPVFADHADHIAGTLIGAGNLNPQYAGVAPGASLTVHTYTTDASSGLALFDFPDAWYNHGIVITSTSQSDGCNAGYTSFAQLMDAQIYQMPSLMHVFSAGNNAYTSCGYGAGTGWGTITGGHKQAKNVITVGNVTKDDLLVANSSRGPARDGRIKPECVAVGTLVTSTSDNPTENTYATKSGSSHSCPGVAGSLALLYQGYKQMHAGADPNSALVKALLLNSCDDLGNPGPDFKFGYGRINTRRSYQNMINNHFFVDSINHSSVWTQNINIPSDIYELRVMLYWNDPSGSVLSSKTLVHDLDLTLTDSLLNQHQPWVLDHTPNATALNSPAIKLTDTLNNIEQITIQQPPSGTWTISVTGTDVAMGYQLFALVYEIISPSLQIIHPNGNEKFVPGQNERIRWDAYSGLSSDFELYFSSDAGMSWQLAADSIPNDIRHFDWTVPSVYGHEYLFKIMQDTLSDISDTLFTIMNKVENISMDSICNDFVKLIWDAVPGASSYIIYQLGNYYMDSLTMSLQNEKWIQYSGLIDEHWFSVAALTSDYTLGQRSNAINRQGNLSDCHTNIDVINHADIVRLYPNPAKDELWLYMPNKTSYNIQLFDVYGKKHQINQKQLDINTNQIDISGIVPGLYILQLNNTTNQQSVRFVKIE